MTSSKNLHSLEFLMTLQESLEDKNQFNDLLSKSIQLSCNDQLEDYYQAEIVRWKLLSSARS